MSKKSTKSSKRRKRKSSKSKASSSRSVAARVSQATFPSTTTAIINLAALAHNLGEVRRRVEPPCQVIGIVKADAYGHGAVPITQTLAKLGVKQFGVATLEEGIALRQTGIRGSILVMGALFPNQYANVMAHALTPVLSERRTVEEFARHAQGKSAPYPVHLKIDTGMGRLGLAPDEVVPLLASSAFGKTLRVEGLMTHLADSDNADPVYTTMQLSRFSSAIAQLKRAGFSVPLIHAANSAAILGHPSAQFTAVRPGIMLYGYHTAPHLQPAPDLHSVLSLTTKVIQVRALAAGESTSYNLTFVAKRPSRIAVLPFGYADGYSRSLSNRSWVLINNRRAPVVGRVCMDMTMVDVTDVPGVSAGTDVTVIGKQGDQQITAADMAAWQGTIPYEVLCAIGPRVRRVYREE